MLRVLIKHDEARNILLLNKTVNNTKTEKTEGNFTKYKRNC